MSTVEEDWRRQLEDDDAPVYPIGVVADMLGVSVQVVRRYDTEEVVQPDRTSGGQRRYSRREIEQLARVLNLADEGIPVAGIKRILALEDELDDLRRNGGENPDADEG